MPAKKTPSKPRPTISSANGASPVAASNFLAQLDPADLADLQALGVVQRFSRGEYVYRVGSAGASVCLLQAGKVKIQQLSPTGREVILWFCLPGEIFGLSEMARGGERAVDAQACMESEVLAVPRERFRSFLAEHPDAALLAMHVLSSRMRVLGEIFVNLVSDDVHTRIAKLIVRLAAQYGTRVGKDVILTIPLTHQEMADMVGTTRQTVTSSFSTLNRQGILRVNNHRICIESPELLGALPHDTR